MTCTITTEFRRGDAFSRTIALVDDVGAALVLDVTDLAAQLYRPDKTMLAELTIAAGSTTGEYVLSCADATAAWPLELLTVNIFDDSDDSSSDKFYVQVTEQISRVLPVVVP